jgi:hypothetical protein
MKHTAVALVLLVGIVSAQSKPKTPSQGKYGIEAPSASSDRAGAGRFHLIAVKAPGRSVGGTVEAYDELFLYDSTTGRVWKYELSTFVGAKGDPDQMSVDPYFSHLPHVTPIRPSSRYS